MVRSSGVLVPAEGTVDLSGIGRPLLADAARARRRLTQYRAATRSRSVAMPTIRSSTVSMPRMSPPETTGSRRTPWARRIRYASCTSASASTATISVDMKLSIRAWGGEPPAIALTTMSRSVTMPARRPASITSRAQPLGVSGDSRRSCSGAQSRLTKLPPNRARPMVTIDMYSWACCSVRASVRIRAVIPVAASTTETKSTPAATGRPRTSGAGTWTRWPWPRGTPRP